MRHIERYVAATILGLVTVVICWISGYANVRFGGTLAIHESDRLIYQAASLALDGYKYVGLVVVGLLATRVRWPLAFVALALWVSAVGFSTLSAVGFATQTRTQVTLDGAGTARAHADLSLQRKALEAQLAGQPQARPAGTVMGLIAKERSDRDRGWSSRVAALQAELATSRESDRILAALRNLADQEREIAPEQAVQTQAKAIKEYVLPNWSLSKIDIGIAIFFALIVEFFSAFGLLLTTKLLQPPPVTTATAEQAAPVTPLTVVEEVGVVHPLTEHLQRFRTDCVELDPESQVQASTLYETYVAWARANNEAPLSGTRFGTLFQLLVDRDVEGSRRWYVGIKLRGLPGHSRPDPPRLRRVA